MSIRRQEALDYHAQGRPGKIQVSPTKPFKNQRDLSLAYTPGVAEPCREIAARPEEPYTYTARGNLVAVVTNGTAVLGLGNIGPLAGKPVMEGKGILFKAFADIDVFDLEVGSEDPEDMIRFCRLLEPTVGGINLEDIRSPDCFHIEETLRDTLSIPVFHDDQHGTAIITGAALLNALELVKKDIGSVRVVFAGAGAAAIATAEHYVRLGVPREHITLCDQQGVVHADRSDLDEYRRRFAVRGKARTLAEALQDADVFVGLSVGGIVSGDMLKGMAKRPIVFALANPNPEITPEEARQARSDAIIATGRSDYPNQVNNVLGFPFIFRGALDVRAKKINDEMEMAATRALAALAKEEVPEAVMRAYGIERLRFGPDYLIPKPFDPRVLLWVAPAVAWAAVGSGVAGRVIDVDEYRAELDARLGRAREVMRGLSSRAQTAAQRIVFPEGEDPRILKAARILADDGVAEPILLGDPDAIRREADDAGVTLEEITLANPRASAHLETFAQELWERRRRKGITLREARNRVVDPLYHGLLMLRAGQTDAVVVGVDMYYPDAMRPALEVIGAEPGRRHVSGIYMLVLPHQTFFFADCAVNIDPDAETLAEIASATAEFVGRLGIEPRVARLRRKRYGKRGRNCRCRRAGARAAAPRLPSSMGTERMTAHAPRPAERKRASALEAAGLTPQRAVYWNLGPPELYEHAVRRAEGVIAEGGAFAAVTAPHTGRSPNDKFIVREPASADEMWWNRGNQPLEADAFERLKASLMAHLAEQELFVRDLFAGADVEHRFGLRFVTPNAWHALFVYNMFLRPSAADLAAFTPVWTVHHAPEFHADPAIHGTKSGTFVVIHFSQRTILIGGTRYAGEMKKSVFTILNYLLPKRGVLSMHCSANLGRAGDVALFFGLSGTGKTTLSADPERALIGDDEHGWSDRGIFNFEGGCYAKVIRLSREGEPEIFATTHMFGTVLENVVVDPDTRAIDLDSDRITENTRASYPIHYIPNHVPSGAGGHPSHILFLTCDAYGIMPPIARLSPAQAMYHFLSGYTAKVAGTERGVTEPKATFSTCFGAPFLPLQPNVYAALLGEKIATHERRVDEIGRAHV